MSLRHLPYEIVFYVAQQLDLEDVYNLSLTCRQFQYLAKEDNICKAVLEVRFNNSTLIGRFTRIRLFKTQLTM